MVTFTEISLEIHFESKMLHLGVGGHLNFDDSTDAIIPHEDWKSLGLFASSFSSHEFHGGLGIDSD